jgi:hypothetical protein
MPSVPRERLSPCPSWLHSTGSREHKQASSTWHCTTLAVCIASATAGENIVKIIAVACCATALAGCAIQRARARVLNTDGGA